MIPYIIMKQKKKSIDKCIKNTLHRLKWDLDFYPLTSGVTKRLKPGFHKHLSINIVRG